MGTTQDAILVVSFGTSYNNNREESIGAIERAIATAFPEWSVRRAFTSRMIINKLKTRDGYSVDTVEEALSRAYQDGIRRLIVQPTHLMAGNEYIGVKDVVSHWQSKFDKLVMGLPLMASEEDVHQVMQAVIEATVGYDDGQTAICLMGHGSDAAANRLYSDFQHVLQKASYQNYYIGTVEANPTLAHLLEMVQKSGDYRKVLLQPLMVVAGDHANNDMAGEDETSWKSVFEKAGYNVTCIIKGLGEFEAIQKIYIQHVAACISACAD